MPFGAVETVVVIGIIIGIILRTVLPYLKAVKQAKAKNEPISFDAWYGGSAIVAILLGALVAMEAIAIVPIPEVISWQGWISAFLGAVTYGYAFNATLNLFVDYHRAPAA